MELASTSSNTTGDTCVDSAASRQVSTTLLSVKSFDKSTETLLDFIRKNKSVALFLRMTGVIRRTNDSSMVVNVLQTVWNTLLRLGLLLMLVYSFALFIEDWEDSRYHWCVTTITLSLQSATLLFALYEIRQRLKNVITMKVVQHLQNGLCTSYVVVILSMTVGILPVLIYMFLRFYWINILFILGELAICCFLSATMYFITLDCAVVDSLLNELSEQAKLELLTFEQYELARNEIEVRQASSSWINNAIVFVAILDIVSVLIFILVLEEEAFRNDLYFIDLSMFLKELPFVVIVYWKVAQVNEKSAKFMKLLSANRWNKVPFIENGLASAQAIREVERLAIFAHAQGNPITMSLAGMKLKRKDLMWQFAAWCLAFVIGLIRTFVLDHV